MSTYTTSCYQIAANSNRVCTENASGILPESKPDYFFHNIGKTEVFVEVIYGTAFGWIDRVEGRTLQPGESTIIRMGTKPFYTTGQKVTNRGNRRALVYCTVVNGGIAWNSGIITPLKYELNDVAKSFIVWGTLYIPAAGLPLSSLIDFFWPDSEESAWDEIKDQLNHLLEGRIGDTIKGILSGDLRSIKERLNVLKIELNDPNSQETRRHYMNIAEDLIGFEKKFSFGVQDNDNYKDANFLLLPMYSALVNLKVLFYRYGIINQQKVKLSNDDIYSIKRYQQRLIEEPSDGALTYINKVFKDQFNSEYDNCNPDTVYDSLALVRQFSAINGFEFFEPWQAIIRDPWSTQKPYNSVISYSTLSGRPTADLAKKMVSDEVAVPLQPKLINGRRNRISKIEGWIFRIYGGTAKINGMKIVYENGESVDQGTWSRESKTVEFRGSYLKSLTAWGYGAIDMLEFEFSDGRKEVCGDNHDARGLHHKFELDKHHIVGILVSNDEPSLAGQVAGIAVSYQLLPQ